MASTRGLSSLGKGVVTVLAALLLLAPVIAAPASLLPPVAALLAVVGFSILLYAYVVSSDEGGGSVWNVIPSRQYDGRHAESGGLARGEQEAAIEEIQQDAAERDPEQ